MTIPPEAIDAAVDAWANAYGREHKSGAQAVIAALQAALPHLARPGPIESAPKDGTWVWLIFEEAGIAIKARWTWLMDDEKDNACFGWGFHDASITAPGAYEDGGLSYAEDPVPNGWLPVVSGSDPAHDTYRDQIRREVIEGLAAKTKARADEVRPLGVYGDYILWDEFTEWLRSQAAGQESE